MSVSANPRRGNNPSDIPPFGPFRSTSALPQLFPHLLFLLGILPTFVEDCTPLQWVYLSIHSSELLCIHKLPQIEVL